jgi:hypothetical protein
MVYSVFHGLYSAGDASLNDSKKIVQGTKLKEIFRLETESIPGFDARHDAEHLFRVHRNVLAQHGLRPEGDSGEIDDFTKDILDHGQVDFCWERPHFQRVPEPPTESADATA